MDVFFLLFTYAGRQHMDVFSFHSLMSEDNMDIFSFHLLKSEDNT
jgi:hypothetical protein